MESKSIHHNSFLYSLAKDVLLLFLVITSLSSCRNKKDLTTPLIDSSTSFDFNPFKKGNFYVYDVEERHYSSANAFDSSGFLKISYEEYWTDAQGGPALKIYRYEKNIDTASYKFNTVWSAALKDNNKFVSTENNVPFIKLYYPLSEGKKWDGNAYNSLGPETYTAINIGKPFEKYPATVTIVQKNDSNLLSRDYRMEIYALKVGLVYKETRTVKYSGSAADFGKGIIVDGVVFKQRLQEHGVE